MTRLRLASAALNQTPLDWSGNAANIIEVFEALRADEVRVACLPELCISGYGCEDAFLWSHTAESALESLASLLPHSHGLVVSVGLPVRVGRQLFNGAALLVDGELVGIACKRHLAADGLHYEPRWFSSWPAGSNSTIEFDGRRIPVGDLIFDVGGLRLGFEICQDAWVEERPAYEFARSGVDLLLCPSASHFAFDKHLIRRQLALKGAEVAKAAYLYCNLLGNEAGRAIYDGDCLVVAPGSEQSPSHVVAEARRLSFKSFTVAAATLSLSQKGAHPGALAGTESRLLVETEFSLAPSEEKPALSKMTPREDSLGRLPKGDAFARAVALGLFDYMRKSRSRGFVVSLSGGADSAVVSLLVRLMVRFAFEELGAGELRERLSYLGSDILGSELVESSLARSLLLTLYQGTKNSSTVTQDAARRVAEMLGTEHHEVSVHELVDGYQKLAEGVLGRDLSWQEDDIALQNIQARVRSPSIWMLANVRGALLLATSNRSEAAVGYATMDGDTSGGLSPIAGVDKAFIRQWLRYLEETGLPEWGPMKQLAHVNQQQPTAELRPPGAHQTDEEDLMPYDVLDLIERASIMRGFPGERVQKMLVDRFDVSAKQAAEWLIRFYRLFAHNQWKRERFAPSFHLDEGNLDPRTWCRFPILSGAFQKEIAQLDEQS